MLFHLCICRVGRFAGVLSTCNNKSSFKATVNGTIVWKCMETKLKTFISNGPVVVRYLKIAYIGNI